MSIIYVFIDILGINVDSINIMVKPLKMGVLEKIKPIVVINLLKIIVNIL